MRSGSCPKCGGKNILHRESVRDHCSGGFDGRFALASGARALHGGAGLGEFEAFICRGCGFTEFYVRDLTDLDRLEG